MELESSSITSTLQLIRFYSNDQLFVWYYTNTVLFVVLLVKKNTLVELTFQNSRVLMKLLNLSIKLRSINSKMYTITRFTFKNIQNYFSTKPYISICINDTRTEIQYTILNLIDSSISYSVAMKPFVLVV